MKRPKLIVSLLVVLFAAPSLCAYFLYRHPQWLPTTTNHGQFIQPPQMLAVLAQRSTWQLIYWYPGTCDASCAQYMDGLARVRLATGRHARQIDTLLLLPAEHGQLSEGLQKQLAMQGSRMLTVASPADQATLGMQPRRYIANPHQALILAYTGVQPLDDIYQDLKHVVADA